MKIFIDTSVIIAALISGKGGSAEIFRLCEIGLCECWISNYIIKETEKVIDRKLPELKGIFKKLIKIKNMKIIKKMPGRYMKKAEKWIKDKNDVTVLAAAKQINADYLITLDIRDFIEDKNVAEKSGLKIITPGNFLQALRLDKN